MNDTPNCLMDIATGAAVCDEYGNMDGDEMNVGASLLYL